MCKYMFYFIFNLPSEEMYNLLLVMLIPFYKWFILVWNNVLWCLAFTQALNLFLSLCLARAAAQNKAALQKLGITHVLNAAHSKRGSIGNQSFYGNSFVYCGIPADDSTHFDLDVYFHPAADFIHKALKSPDGKTPQSFVSPWSVIFLHSEL